MIAALALVGALFGFAFAASQSKVFEADATTLVQRQSLAKSLNNIVDPGSQPNEGPRVLEAQANIALSPIVAAATLKAVPGTGLTVSELLDSVTVSPDVNGDLLDFALTNASGPTAVRLVNEYVDQYVDYSSEVDRQSAEVAAVRIRSRMRALERSGDAASASYKQFSENLDSLRSIISLSTPRAQVIAKASDYTQIKPKPIVSLILGLFLGLAVGVGLAFLLNSLDKSVRDPEEIADVLGLPLLTVVPSAARRKRDGSGSSAEDSERAESFRVLLAAITGAADLEGGASLLVSGVASPAANSSIAINLARASAHSGHNTALLDIGFRNPSLTRSLNQQGHLGASDILLRSEPLSAASVVLSPTSDSDALSLVGELTLIPVGESPEQMIELIGSRSVRELIDQLTSNGTLVIVDAGAALNASESASAASFVDHILLVAEADATQYEALEQTRSRLDLASGAPIGVAVVDSSS